MTEKRASPPGLSDLARVFGRIGLISFGGPAAQIALMHRELVEARSWLTEKQYLGALSFCMLLPGPEAMQLATWAGWRLGGAAGGLVAGGLFVAPGAVLVLALALAYAVWGALPLAQAAFLGIQAAVVVIVAQALVRLSRKALDGVAGAVVAGLAFLGIFALSLPFPLIVLAAGLWGAAAARDAGAPPPPAHPAARPGRTAGVLAIGAAVWAAPFALTVPLGADLLTEIGLFFSKLAVVTFGGAYAVLAYMTQEVVQVQGWIATEEMLDGLGLAETTPGPLILVTEFVGALAAHREGGWPLALAGAAITLWATFVPSFVWILAGAPWLERITAAPRLRGALDAITAAAVGVIANLSLWFAAHVFFAEVGTAGIGPVRVILPAPESLDPAALALAGVGAALLLWLRWPLPAALAALALAGVAIGLWG